MGTKEDLRGDIRFYFDGQVRILDDVRATDMVMPWLRSEAMRTGTKEGCNEGDCGACTCLVGSLSESGDLRFTVINTCIYPLAYLDGAWLISVETLSRSGSLCSAQSGMLPLNASQCGFCTPGFVMAIVYAQITKKDQTPEQALAGNLCRCTGYSGLIEATRLAQGQPLDKAFIAEIEGATAVLRQLSRGGFSIVNHNSRIDAPKTLDHLLDLRKNFSSATLVSGATDFGLWITKRLDRPTHIILTKFCEQLLLKEIRPDNIEIGAAVTIEDLENSLVFEYPELQEWFQRFGGPQVRCSGTLGGNIANGSPIGDSAPVLIALGASLTIHSCRGNRVIPMEDFFIEYGKQDLLDDEVLVSILIPRRAHIRRFAVEKISKRYDQDISIVLAAMAEISGDRPSYRFAFGGMAGTPKLAEKTMESLNPDDLTSDFSPLSDHRAEAWYRLAVSKNLVRDFLDGEASRE